VSAAHARIFSRDGSWFVEDLGSTNGTYLNQRRVTTASELRAGDRLRVGKTTLELRR
jgi:pSer/pThr/pTyr-binding forkhead associated (FHA) protein